MIASDEQASTLLVPFARGWLVGRGAGCVGRLLVLTLIAVIGDDCIALITDTTTPIIGVIT